MIFYNINLNELAGLAFDHLLLVVVATAVAVGIGVPLGVWLTRHQQFQRAVLGAANVLQTVPSLALFGLLIPLPLIGGIGARVAIIALVLYALLPIIRNTVTGIEAVDRNVREAAVALGMTDRQILWQVELPLAWRVIIAGVRVAAVIGVGVATIAAAIGASGLGVYIFRGVRMNDNVLVLAGAIPAAVLALAVDAVLGAIEKSFDVKRSRQRTVDDIKDTHDANDDDEFDKSTASTRTVFGAHRRAVVAAMLLTGLMVAGGVWRSGAWSFGKSKAVRVGSKDFTESVLLAEILAQNLEREGVQVERKYELAGTLCHEALINNQIDVYPEYTGTGLMAILKLPPMTDATQVYQTVRDGYAANFDVVVSPSLGFRNDFAILVRGQDARRYNLKKISDVAPLARQWRAGFGQDFVSRPDGYAGFIKTYDLQFQQRPREMDLSLTYRALAAGEVDLIAGNSTDGLIEKLDLVQLEDDRRYFPPYDAVMLVRRDTLERTPALQKVLTALADSISVRQMQRMNYAVDGEKQSPPTIVRKLINNQL